MKYICTLFLLVFFNNLFVYSQKGKGFTIKDGLVLCYLFNGNSLDISGNNNNGIVKGAMLANDRNNKSNSAYYFSAGSNILIDNTSSLTIAKNFTFSVWFNSEKVNDGQTIIAKSGDRTGIELKVAGNEIQINDGHCCPVPYTLKVGEYKLNKWYHVLFSFDGKYLKVYLNGKLVIKISDLEFDLNYKMADEPIRIGIGQAGKYYPFYGYIDDVYVWNRDLSDVEIKTFCKMQLKNK